MDPRHHLTTRISGIPILLRLRVVLWAPIKGFPTRLVVRAASLDPLCVSSEVGPMGSDYCARGLKSLCTGVMTCWEEHESSQNRGNRQDWPAVSNGTLRYFKQNARGTTGSNCLRIAMFKS